MKQAICDKCKRVLKEEDFDKITSVKLPYLKTYHGTGSCWQYKTFDLCDECVDKLNDLIEQIKCDFITKE